MSWAVWLYGPRTMGGPISKVANGSLGPLQAWTTTPVGTKESRGQTCLERKVHYLEVSSPQEFPQGLQASAAQTA